jgi:hypothetical protein
MKGVPEDEKNGGDLQILKLVEPGTTSETPLAVPVANASKGKPHYVT